MMKFLLSLAAMTCLVVQVAAQDIVGIENCSAEKAMDRRTGCLQANVNYLHGLVTRNAADSQRQFAAANTEIVSLKAAVASLQARVEQLAAAAKAAENAAKKKEDGKGSNK